MTRGDGVALVGFLKATAIAVLDQNKHVTLDFRKTESIYVPGAVLLLAELDRIVTLSDLAKPLTVINPINVRAREVLKQIELHELTGDRCDVIPRREDVVFWKANKGNTHSGKTLGPILEFVADRANKVLAKQVELKGIWRGVTEAVTNSVDHAYKFPREDGFSGLPDTKWWMLTQIRNGIFTAAVCDLGCGYRKTVQLTLPEEFFAGFSAFIGRAGNADTRAVQAAMEYGRSGTQESHRGKGSRDALSVLSTAGEGELHVLSHQGWVRYLLERGQSLKDVHSAAFDLGIDTGATIVWWNLPVGDIRR